PDGAKPPSPALLIDCSYNWGEDQLANLVADRIPETSPRPETVRPWDVDWRGFGIEVHREGGRDADEWQAQMFSHRPAGWLNLVDDESVDALIADRGRRVPKEHLRLHHDSANAAAQGSESFELAKFLVARAERADGKV